MTADTLGRVDLNPHFGVATSNSVAYGAVYLISPEDRTVTLAIESDDDVEAWIGARRVLRHDVARGVGSGTDTVTVRLAGGANRLLYKVVNRLGGFGLGGRLLASGPDPIDDIEIRARRPADATLAAPAPSLTLGPIRVAPRAVLGASSGAPALLVRMDVAAVRWGGLAAPITLAVGATRAAVGPDSASVVSFAAPWPRLAALGAAGRLAIRPRIGARDAAAVPLPGAGSLLLRQLAQPIAIEGWQATSSAAALAAAPAAWRPLEPRPDSTLPRPRDVTAIRVATRVPPTLAGLRLRLDAAELLPGAAIRVNGRVVEADSLGRIDPCGGPCPAGASLRVEVALRGDTWWDPPRIYVADAGWYEIADGARWLRTLSGDSAVAAPGEDVARALLAAATSPDKAGYRDTVRDWLSRLEPAAAAVRADTIDLVGNSHIDAAWLWRWRETVDVVKRTWGTAVKLMDKYPRMRFAASAARYYAWLDSVAPDTLRAIQRLAREGRWAPVGGWWVEPDANLPSGESLVRQGLYGQRAFIRYFGEPARVGWLPDTFGYAWTLPQILRGQGLEYFVTQKLRWNDTNEWPSSLDLFWWQGPDGSRVLTYIPYGYDNDLEGADLASQWKATKDSAAVPTMLTLYGVGDHGGGPTMRMLERRRMLQRLPAFPTLRDVRPAEALDRMRDATPDSTPTIADELYLEYHRGVYTTHAAMKAWNRHLEALLGAAEAAATAAAAPPSRAAYPRAALTDAWEKVLFNQFHDLLPGSGIAPIYVDAVADYRAAQAEADSVLDASLRALAAARDTRPPRPGLRPYVVFNPDARPRAGVARLAVTPALAPPLAFDARGRRLPSTLRGDTLLVRLREVPGTGTALVFVGARAADAAGARGAAPLSAPAPAALENAVLENAFLRVAIDPRTGDVARLRDLRSGRDLIAPGAEANALVMLEDRPRDWDAWNIDDLNGARTPLDRDVSVGPARRDGLGRAIVVHRGAAGVGATQRYFLPDSAARLDVETTVEWHASHELLKASFPLALHVDSVHAEIPYGVIARTTRPTTSRDSARFEAPMQRWLDAGGRGVGVALVNDGKYGYDAHGDTVRLTLLRSPKYPDPNTDMGTHRFTYSIVPHAGDWRAGAIRDAVLELNAPLRALEVASHAAPPAVSTGASSRDRPAPGAPGPAEAGGGTADGYLRLRGEGVVVGALKRAEDGGGIVVRLVETHGRAADATLRLAGRGHFTLVETDLIERPAGERIEATDGAASVRLRPWQIRTFFVADPPSGAGRRGPTG